MLDPDLGLVLTAVQESLLLPPPTQLDILYGLTDLGGGEEAAVVQRGGVVVH